MFSAHLILFIIMKMNMKIRYTSRSPALHILTEGLSLLNKIKIMNINILGKK